MSAERQRQVRGAERCTYGEALGRPCGRPAAWRLNPEAIDDPPLGPAATAFMRRTRLCVEHFPRYGPLVFEDGMPLLVRV